MYINPIQDTPFKSKIKFITQPEFSQKIRGLDKSSCFVDYPWTIETMKTGNNLYTTGIIECITGFITNGTNTALFHLGLRDEKQAARDKVKKFDIDNVESNLSQKVNLNAPNLHCLLFGGWENLTNVEFKQIKSMLGKYEFPISTICQMTKDIHYVPKASVMYSEAEDTFYITNSHTKNERMGKHGFIKNEHEIEVSGNTIEFSTYKKLLENFGFKYIPTRRKTSTEEYFKTQYKEVSLSDGDCFE